MTETPDTAGAGEVGDQPGRHELPPDEPAPQIGDLQSGGVKGVARRGRSQLAFGALGVLLCVLLGVAIVTQVRQNESGDSLETARPADLLVLLDSLQQLADRTSLDPLARFVDGLLVAIERGTPLAEVLRAQAADVREAGKRRLLEAGGRKEIAMMVPVVFLVLPVTVLFALFPGLISIVSLAQ